MPNASGRGRRRACLAATAILLLVVVDGVAPPGVASAAPISQRWLTLFDRGNSATASGISPDGSTVFVTGSGGGRRSGGDYLTVAYDAVTGKDRWVGRYDGPAGMFDGATALGVSPDGSRVFVTGGSVAANGAPDLATVAYDSSTGAEVWAARYGRLLEKDVAVALATSADGSVVFVTGQTQGARGNRSVTIAYEAAGGRRLWVAPRGGETLISSLDVSADGSIVFISGGSGVSYSEHFVTVAYDAATGAQMWMRRYRPGVAGYAEAVGVSPDGSTVFVTGHSFAGTFTDSDADSDYGYATVAYEAATGTQLWVARFDGLGHESDWGRALDVSPDGSMVFVTGEAQGQSSPDYATVAYDAETGAEQWVAWYAGSISQDGAVAVLVSPDGSEVFVTGTSWGEVSLDWATVAYDAAMGAELWVDRYDGPVGFHDFANSLAISRDGSTLFVTGTSTWPPPSYASAHVTIAYDVG